MSRYKNNLQMLIVPEYLHRRMFSGTGADSIRQVQNINTSKVGRTGTCGLPNQARTCHYLVLYCVPKIVKKLYQLFFL